MRRIALVRTIGIAIGAVAYSGAVFWVNLVGRVIFPSVKRLFSAAFCEA
jgi:hypothetical protein